GSLCRGLVYLYKRQAEKFDFWDFRLEKYEVIEIAKLDQGKRLGPDPDEFGGFFPITLTLSHRER
ncbi:hypothetical protein ACVGXA_04760, partial [Enterobacter hormaechei]